MGASDPIGVLVAVLAAFTWGTGDYSGGRAANRLHPYQVLAMVSLTGVILLLGVSLLLGEPWPTPTGILWCSLAGFLGGVGIAALYRGLAVAEAAVVAPTASVVGVILPVIIGARLIGLPTPIQILGMLLGTAGIWIAAQGSDRALEPRRGLGLGILAGLGFGGFFVSMAQVHAGSVFTPLVISKTVATALGLIVILTRRLSVPSPGAHPWALLSGVLDASGNVFYLMATRLTRLDFAALVASMSPAVVVVLAAAVSRQRVAARQWVGVALCMAAIALIAA